MTEHMELRAERQIVGRLLDRDPDSLGYLDRLGLEGARELREEITDRLYSGDEDRLRRVAAGAGVVPIGLSATIGRKVFGPLLCARITGLLPPDRAREMAAHLDPPFLADIAVELDPRRAGAVISQIPAERAAEVAKVLTERDELVTMGRFVAHLQEDAIAACLEVIPEDKLLQIACLMEDKSRLDPVLDLVADERLEAGLGHATDLGLWPELISLIPHVSKDNASRVAAQTARSESDTEVLATVATREGLWEDALGIVSVLDEESRRRFAAAPAMQEPGTTRAIFHAAVQKDLWGELLPLLPLLEPQTQILVAELISELDEQRIGEIVTEVAERDEWESMAEIAVKVDPQTRERIAAILVGTDPRLLQEAVRSIDQQDLWPRLIEIVDGLPAELKAELGQVLGAASEHSGVRLPADIVQSLGD